MGGRAPLPLEKVEPLAIEPIWLAQLRQEVAELRTDLAQLRRENLELRRQAGHWRSRHAAAKQRIAESEHEVAQLCGGNRQLQDQLFGLKSEKASSRDRSDSLDGEVESAPFQPARRGQRQDRPGPKRRDYSHLPVIEDLRELPEPQLGCPECGTPFSPGDTEDSEQIEIEVRPYRRRIRRRRYQRVCSRAVGLRTITAPLPPKLIPKGLLGVSIWVEILLQKYFSHCPTERLLASWRQCDLDVAAGTATHGLERLEPLFQPRYRALLARNARSALAQADETRRMVFIARDGKSGYRWWLWVLLGDDTVVFRLDPNRSHEVPEGHFPDDARVVVMVDRHSAYRAMAQVKTGHVILAFCRAHVRRDLVKVGKGWEESKEWAVAWPRRIRTLYRQHHRRRDHAVGSVEFATADAAVQQSVATMQTRAETELADPKLATPCREVLVSLQEHWSGLTRFVDDLRIPPDKNASERQARGPAPGRKDSYGSGASWSGRLAAGLLSPFATLTPARLNIRKWLTWYLHSCAANGGQVPRDLASFLPWTMSPGKRHELALDPDDSS